nr:cache domain-containing protein [Limisalsivibrio acetivorans]
MRSVYSSRIRGFSKTNTELINAFAEGDRDKLYELSLPKYKTLQRENPYFQSIFYVTSNAKAFLRMHKPDEFGDDVSGLAFIDDVINSKKMVSGFVYTKSSVFYRVVAPVYKDREFIGLIGFSIDIAQIGDTVKRFVRSEYGIFVQNTREADFEDYESFGDHVLIQYSSTTLRDIPENFDFYRYSTEIEIEDRHYVSITKKLTSYDERVLGSVVILLNLTEMVHSHFFHIMSIIGLAVFVIILSSLILYMSFGNMIGRMDKLNRDLEKRVEERTTELVALTKKLQEEVAEHKLTSGELFSSKEEAVKQNELISGLYQRFKNMFLDHQAIMLLYEPETGDIVDVNMAASEFFGYPREQFKRMNVRDISTMNSSTLENTFRKIDKTGIKGIIVKDRLADGDVRDMEVHASPVRFEKGVYHFAILHDVTEKIKYEQDLRDLNANLEKRVEEETWKRREQEQLLIQQTKMSAAGEMLSAVIHQWRQPMAALTGYIQDIEDAIDFDQLDEEYLRESVAKCMGQLNYMSQTIDDFRSFLTPSRVKTDFNLREMLVETVKIVAPQLEKDRIRLLITCSENTDQEVYGRCDLCHHNIEEACIFISTFVSGYPNEMKQVVLNIIHNAREAVLANPEEGDFNGTILLKMEKYDHTVSLSVEDTGQGISEDNLGKIFLPYFTTKGRGGTGIGLYMSKSIIENHMKGKLEYHSGEKGAVFIITLPEAGYTLDDKA